MHTRMPAYRHKYIGLKRYMLCHSNELSPPHTNTLYYIIPLFQRKWNKKKRCHVATGFARHTERSHPRNASNYMQDTPFALTQISVDFQFKLIYLKKSGLEFLIGIGNLQTTTSNSLNKQVKSTRHSAKEWEYGCCSTRMYMVVLSEQYTHTHKLVTTRLH